jgi:hypothetical protein
VPVSSYGGAEKHAVVLGLTWCTHLLPYLLYSSEAFIVHRHWEMSDNYKRPPRPHVTSVVLILAGKWKDIPRVSANSGSVAYMWSLHREETEKKEGRGRPSDNADDRKLNVGVDSTARADTLLVAVMESNVICTVTNTCFCSRTLSIDWGPGC